MIKNFLDADEDDSLITKQSVKKEPESAEEFEQFAEPFSEIEAQANDLPELSESPTAAPPVEEFKEIPNESDAPEKEIAGATFGETSHEPKFDKSSGEKFWEKQLEALKAENHTRHGDLQTDDFQNDDFETVVRPKNEQGNDAPVNFQTVFENETVNSEPPVKEEQTGFILPRLETNQPFAETLNEIKNEPAGESNGESSGVRRREDATLFSQSPYHSETPDETIRKSGLAYTAAIVLTASIVFTLILGWFADLLLGTSPWGKVGGIVLGAIVGFVQFFRTTSEIFKNKE